MSSQRYTPEFKDEAVRQILERGYSVAEVSERLGVSSHSLYKWVKAVKPDNSEQQATELIEAKREILRLRSQLRRTEEERDILKKAARYFAGVCFVRHRGAVEIGMIKNIQDASKGLFDNVKCLYNYWLGFI